MGKDIDMFDLDIREVSAEEVLEMTYSRSDVCVCPTEASTCPNTCNFSCGAQRCTRPACAMVDID